MTQRCGGELRYRLVGFIREEKSSNIRILLLFCGNFFVWIHGLTLLPLNILSSSFLAEIYVVPTRAFYTLIRLVSKLVTVIIWCNRDATKSDRKPLSHNRPVWFWRCFSFLVFLLVGRRIVQWHQRSKRGVQRVCVLFWSGWRCSTVEKWLRQMLLTA